MVYKVWNVECWGHASKDCCASYSCGCVTSDDEGEETHDDDACQCGFEMNDRAPVGSVDVGSAVEPACEACKGTGYVHHGAAPGPFLTVRCDCNVLVAMKEAGFFRDSVKLSDLALDWQDSDLMIDAAETGEQLFQLEGCES